jgi:hypothetical protein
MKKRWINQLGRTSNLVRFSSGDWELIENYITAKGMKKYEYYDASSKAFLDHVTQSGDITIVPTPVTKDYRSKTIYLEPEMHARLDEIADARGISVGRVMATAILHLVQFHYK